MDTRIATNSIRLQQWREIIRQRGESGLSVKDFCLQNNLSKNAYYYWLKKLREAAIVEHPATFAELIPAQEPFASDIGNNRFMPQMTLTVNKVELGVNQDTPTDLIKNILEVVNSAK